MKIPAPLACKVFVVQSSRQIAQTGLEFGHTHVARPEIDVEQGAKLPGLGTQQATFALQSLIERRAGESGLHRDLHLVQAAVAHELPDFLETAGCGVIQAEDETAIHGYAVVLNAPNAVEISVPLGERRIEAAQNSQLNGQPRWVCTVRRL